nr:hypothetical protein Iba_chr12aCG11480 [Ipomoea batatas]
MENLQDNPRCLAVGAALSIFGFGYDERNDDYKVVYAYNADNDFAAYEIKWEGKFNALSSNIKTMAKEQVVFMHAIAMKQQSTGECSQHFPFILASCLSSHSINNNNNDGNSDGGRSQRWRSPAAHSPALLSLSRRNSSQRMISGEQRGSFLPLFRRWHAMIVQGDRTGEASRKQPTGPTAPSPKPVAFSPISGSTGELSTATRWLQQEESPSSPLPFLAHAMAELVSGTGPSVTLFRSAEQQQQASREWGSRFVSTATRQGIGGPFLGAASPTDAS